MDGITAPPRLPQGAQSRAHSFGTGLVGDPRSAASSLSFAGDAERWNALTPRQVGLSSVLQTAIPSMNGIGQSDQQRVLPGPPGQSIMLPSQNGTSTDSWSKAAIMHLAGQSNEI
jgi:hypothetical protein